MKKTYIYGKVSRCVWESEDIAYLREHFPYESAIDIADHFGVSYSTIRTKAKELGLEKSPGYTPSKYHNRYIRDYKHLKEGYKSYCGS